MRKWANKCPLIGRGLSLNSYGGAAKFWIFLRNAIFQKNNLTRHFKLHSGEKAFSCHICSKVFSRKDSLTLHLRTHNGIKPHKCNHCTKCFSQKSSLTKHLRKHTVAKLFKCKFCLKAFSRRDTCKRQQRNHSVVEVESLVSESFLELRIVEALKQLA